jgi:hypothetical protein
MRIGNTVTWIAIAVAITGTVAAAEETTNAPTESRPTSEVPPPPFAAASQPPAAEKPTHNEPPKRLTVGSGGYFEPGLLLQGWFLTRHATDTSSTFRLRRAELHAKGEILPGRVRYGLMIDPAKVLEFQDTSLAVSHQDPAPTDPSKPETVTAKQPTSAISMLQDFFVTVASAYLDVSLGQFKTPVSWEGYNSSSKLLFPERAPVSRAFGDKRDIGVRVSKFFRYFGYSAGVFNGAGQNSLDTNNEKDVALRLEAYPFTGLVLAGVVYATVGERTSNVKDRYEADLRFERGPFLFQAEYIRAHDLGKAAPATDAQGFYGAIAWTFFDVLQPCVRVGYLDPNVHTDVDPGTAKGEDELWHVDAGLNYYLRKNEAKLQLSYSRFQYDTRTPNNEVTFAGQVSF